MTQGCTTVVTGNWQRAHRRGGHLRVSTGRGRHERDPTHWARLTPPKHHGGGNRAPTADELQRMREKLEQGLREGVGDVDRLNLHPGMFAKTDELIELSKSSPDTKGSMRPICGMRPPSCFLRSAKP